MIEIHLFEQLVAFASCGTLSAAADQLHISQPALSRSMQRLEDELGIKLFDRHKSRITLNDNGELAVRYARNLLLQETTMIEQLRDFDRKKRTIFVGFCTPVLIPDFVSLLSQIYERYDHFYRGIYGSGADRSSAAGREISSGHPSQEAG